MKRSLRLLGYLCLPAFIIAGATAHAESFSFTATGSYTLNASGSLTAIADPGNPNALEVTSISGTLNGIAITGLLPCATYSASNPCSSSGSDSFGYDNLLYPDGLIGNGIQMLDFAGIGFALGTGGLEGDFAADGSHTDIFYYNDEPGDAGPYDIGFSLTPTPEPGSFILLGTALLGMAGAARRLLRI